MTLYDLDKAFERMIKEFPQARATLVEKVGEELYQNVVRNIESDTDEVTGNLKRAVTKIIGSKGGYAAIKPNWGIAPHTHLVENGHEVIRQEKYKNVTAKKKKYNKEPKQSWVEGKHMYRNALNEFAEHAIPECEEMMKELVGDIFD
ncbi:MAG: hypothetical protein RSD67_05940 [Oscillospiraceae bacterium]